MKLQKKMKKRKKLLSCILAAVLVLPTAVYSIPTAAEPDPSAAGVSDSAEDTSSADGDSENAWKDRSEDEVFQKMRKVAENDNLELWAWDLDKVDKDNDEKPEDILALKNKKNGYIWWSSPINAEGDSIAAPALKKELGSGLVLTAAQINERAKTNVRSGETTKTTISHTDIKNGVKVTYNFIKKVGITVPVSYTLGEDYLQVSIDTTQIKEKNDAKSENPVLAYTLAVLNSFGAADSQEEGYFVVPDGSGAVINFNNQKYTAKTYSQLIYNVDTTAVPKTKGPVVEGVSLPMYGIVKGENALLGVAAKGDGSCYLCADVSGTGQSNTEYNRCYFKFLLRSSDTYFLGSDQTNGLDVYEKKLAHRELQVRYYPLTTSDEINEDHGENLDYVDIAARYRQYLLEEQKVPVSAKANEAKLYLDLYGGCMKQKNILGFPVFMKTGMTKYSQMQKILQQVQNAGGEQMVVSMNRWTDAGISGKVDYKADPSGTLGGKSDFKKLKNYLNDNQIEWYPTVSNTAYYSGQGYWSLTDTAVRVSGSFARIVDYERAYGVPYGEKDTMSLLSPSEFTGLYQKMAKNYQKAGFKSASIGALSSNLYGDYGKKSATSRDQTLQKVQQSLEGLRNAGMTSILSEDPNAYVLPYTSTITDLPLYSSGFNIFDGDIPLYQMVMHGVIPYSTKAVNGSADAERLVMLALASGSNLRFDMIYAETSELKDTDFDIYYYAYYDYWTENAAQYYTFTKDVLSAVSDSHIVSYVRDGNLITTEYANGVKTVVDLEACSVEMNGQVRYMKDYVQGGTVVLK